MCDSTSIQKWKWRQYINRAFWCITVYLSLLYYLPGPMINRPFKEQGNTHINESDSISKHVNYRSVFILLNRKKQKVKIQFTNWMERKVFTQGVTAGFFCRKHDMASCCFKRLLCNMLGCVSGDDVHVMLKSVHKGHAVLWSDNCNDKLIPWLIQIGYTDAHVLIESFILTTWLSLTILYT